MTTIVQLDPQWQQWIQHNLDRGCSESSIVETLVREKFDGDFALQTVRMFVAIKAGSTFVTGAAATLLDTQPVAESYGAGSPRFTHQGNLIQTMDRAVKVAARLLSPLVVVLQDLLAPEECDELVRLAALKLKRSTIIDPATGAEEVIEDRNSSGTFFAINENEFIARLDRRIAEVMCCPVDHGEGLQILRYGIGGEYKAHFDYFPPQDSGSRVHMSRGGQRVSTLVMYLNNVTGGGETTFPKLSLSVAPLKGSAVYFEYCDHQGRIDPRSLHGGLPVSAGEKWIATKWIREGPYRN